MKLARFIRRVAATAPLVAVEGISSIDAVVIHPNDDNDDLLESADELITGSLPDTTKSSGDEKEKE